jgi:hypothetical protein
LSLKLYLGRYVRESDIKFRDISTGRVYRKGPRVIANLRITRAGRRELQVPRGKLDSKRLMLELNVLFIVGVSNQNQTSVSIACEISRLCRYMQEGEELDVLKAKQVVHRS